MANSGCAVGVRNEDGVKEKSDKSPSCGRHHPRGRSRRMMNLLSEITAPTYGQFGVINKRPKRNSGHANIRAERNDKRPGDAGDASVVKRPTSDCRSISINVAPMRRTFTITKAKRAAKSDAAVRQDSFVADFREVIGQTRTENQNLPI
jgi:hypothetical protein